MVYNGHASCPHRPHNNTQLPACSLLCIYAVMATMQPYALNVLARLLTLAPAQVAGQRPTPQ